MNSLRVSLVVAVGIMMVLEPVSAQDQLPFRDAIRSFADSREKIETYELRLTITERGRPQRATDGVVYPAAEQPEVTLEIAADRKNNKLLVAKYQQADGKTALQQLDVRTPRYRISVRDSQRWITPPSDRQIEGFFDPLALGIALIGDMGRGTSLPEIVEYYMDWPSLRTQPLADGIVKYGEDDGKSSYLLFLDSKRGFTPIRLRDRTDREGVFRVDQEMTSKNGYWLPASAVIEEPKRNRTLRFDWITINSKIDDRFDPRQIETTYAVDLIDRR